MAAISPTILMKARSLFCIFLAIGTVLTTIPAGAQDYFRELDTRSYGSPEPVPPSYPIVDLGPSTDTTSFSVLDRYEPVNPPNESEAEKYNMAMGPLRFNVAAGIGVEYNSNIALSPSGEEEDDFIIRPSLVIDATWRLSEMNTLRFSLGASYAKYINHSEFDSRGVLLSPSSAIAMTVLVSNVRITVRDRFSYQEDPYDEPFLSNTATYRRFENDAGIQADWAVNEWLNITTGYSHYNNWVFDDEFDSLQRQVNTVYLRPSVEVSPAVRVGLNGSVSWVDYSEKIQNDGTTYFAGAFTEIDLTSNTRFYLEGGYQSFDFDNNGTIADNQNSSTWYARVEVLNRLSEAFSHRLSFTKTTETGYQTNFYDLYHVEYAANWQLTSDLTFAPTAFYEYYQTSDGDGAFSGEDASRVGCALGLRYVFTPSVTLGLDYRFLLKDSNLADASYQQHLVLLSLFYNF